MSGLCFRIAICAHPLCQFLKELSTTLLRIRIVDSECGLHQCQVQTSLWQSFRTVWKQQLNHQKDSRLTFLDHISVSIKQNSNHATNHKLTKHSCGVSASSMPWSWREESSDLLDGISHTNSVTLIFRFPKHSLWCSFNIMITFHGRP